MRVFPLLAAALVAISASACGPVECIRAIRCVERCGGPVLQSGCFACPGGTFDDIVCVPDAGPEDAPAPTEDAGSSG